MEHGLNSPLTSSAGRLFDAAAALVGLRYTTSYEGQAACELEGIAAPDEKGSYPCRVVDEGDGLVVVAKDIIAGVVEDLAAGSAPEMVSARFHNSVLNAIMEVVTQLRESTGIDEVALSGGVWQNARLLSGAIERLAEAGMTVYTQRLVPANDGGVSLGQAVVVASGGGVELSASGEAK
jgi:hydrogenase maturation protein HypF